MNGDNEERKEEATEKNEQQVKEVQTQVQTLMTIGSECSFFHDENDDAFAVVPLEDCNQTFNVRSRKFRSWLTHKYYKQCQNAPSSESITRALGAMEAAAMYEGDQHALHYRVASDKGQFYYDLADKEWRVVVIKPGSWDVAEHPFLFKRGGNTAPQVEPLKGGRLDKVLDYVNLTSVEDQILYQVHLVACLVPEIPKPLLLLIGEKGAAKSTMSRITKRLVDPAGEELLTLPRDQNELGLQLSKNYMVAYDNLDGMQNWQSDLLAKGVTGGGITKRMLFKDADEIILKFKRCIVLNGIHPAVTRSDLLDRTIPITLERISKEKRQAEAEFWQRFEADRPYIFGAMLTNLAKAMQIYPSVKLSELPRMADFCKWGYAIAEAMGIGGATFIGMYWGAIEKQNDVAIDHHPIAAAMRIFMYGISEWKGSPKMLMEELFAVAELEKIDTQSRSWPKAAQGLTKRLKEVKSNLIEIGITFSETRTGASRFITLRNGSSSSQSSSASFDNQITDVCDSSDGNDATTRN